MSTTHDQPPRPRGAPLDFEQSREVVATALEMQDAAEREAQAAERLRALGTAAKEVGLDPAHLEEAEAVVRMRVLERARREVAAARTRRRVAAGVAVGLAAVGLGAWVVRPPPAVEPWVDPLSAGWTLESSAGSTASVAVVTEGARGQVTAVTVERFVPLGDDRFWVNLESTAHPDWTGAVEVSFAARGEGLDAVRLYLETPDERWRGPVVPVGAEWAEHTVAIRDFERQVKRGGEWEVVGWEAPRTVDTVSFKLGSWVNEAGEAGTVWLDDLGVR